MAKFYGLDSSFIHDAEPKDGFVIDMVRASDYVELENRIAELEKQRDGLVAENSALKSKGLELAREASAVYELQNKIIGPEDFIDGQTLHEFREIAEEVTATDAAIAEIGAKAVEKLGERFATVDPVFQARCFCYANKLRGGGV